jgi:RNA polymerase sigma-70 factor (ECF subfamily)
MEGFVGKRPPTGGLERGVRVTGQHRAAVKHACSGFHTGTLINESPRRLAETQLLVAQAKEGDRDAWCSLYVQYANSVYTYVRSILRDDSEAEDVTQHVFTKLMTAVVKYDDRGIPFAAWLLRLARNVAIDHLRANRLTPTDHLADRDTGIGADLDRAQVVRIALAALPEEQRQVVILRHVVGLTPAEIAARLGRTESSIHGLHHRGRLALQRELARLESTPRTRAKTELVAA